MDNEYKAELEILQLTIKELTRELSELRARVVYLERMSAPLEIDDKTLAEAVMEHEQKFKQPALSNTFPLTQTQVSRRKGGMR